MPDETTTPDPTTPTTTSSTPPTPRALSPRPNRGVSLRRKGAAWQALKTFEDAAGGRDSLAEILAAAPLDQKQKNLLAMMLDPVRAGDSLADLLADAGVAPNEVISLFRDAAMTSALTAGTLQLTRHMPKVLDSVAVAASDRREPCDCTLTEDEEVFAPPNPDCPKCSGRGFLAKKGRFEQQQLFMEALNFLKRGGGVAVQVNTQTNVGFSGGFFDKFVKATDDAAYQGGVVDAEISAPGPDPVDPVDEK